LYTTRTKSVDIIDFKGLGTEQWSCQLKFGLVNKNLFLPLLRLELHAELLLFADSRLETNLNLMVWGSRLICFAFQDVDLVVSGVIFFSLDISRWEL
jgi:hypothetical protein